MAYRLDPTGTPRDELVAAASEQLTEAISSLRAVGGGTDVGEHVHAARKRLRRFRSTLRLVRPALGRQAYDRAATPTRDLGRRLSIPRDADVLAKTVRSLIDDSPGEPSREAIARELAVRWEAVCDAIVDDAGLTSAAPATLSVINEEVEDWQLGDLAWTTLLQGVVRSYRRGRDAFELARRRGSPERVHEARKRAKDLRYQLELLRDVWTPMMSGQADGARELTETIGTLRDLDLLRGVLAAGDLDPHGAAVLAADVDARMAPLHDRVIGIGTRLYAEKPGAMERRILAYEPRGEILVT